MLLELREGAVAERCCGGYLMTRLAAAARVMVAARV